MRRFEYAYVLLQLLFFAATSSSMINKQKKNIDDRQLQFTVRRRRRAQATPCSAPAQPGGCNYGLWNEETCECDCIPVSYLQQTG